MDRQRRPVRNRSLGSLAGSVELRRLSALQRAIAALSGAVTPQEVARELLDHGLALLGARGGFASRVEGEVLRRLERRGVEDDVVRAGEDLSLSAPLPFAEAARTGRPIWLESTGALEAHDPDLASLASRAGVAALAAVPLRARGRVLGVMSLLFARPRGQARARAGPGGGRCGWSR